jgi:SAM-dependent methyltransferase
MTQFWDVRFASPDFIYGKEPNQFFKSVIDTLPQGKLLVPGAGEGRDGVYAATLGWDVVCVDQSVEGSKKAHQLADEQKVTITYEVSDIELADFPDASFDAVAAIFFHLPSPIRQRFLNNVVKWLKPGGTLILQSFTPRQLGRASGGPKDVDMLPEPAEIDNYKDVLIIERQLEMETELSEGTYHSGMASVAEVIARKK